MDLQVQKIFAIALGGALGAVCRYAITMAAFRTWGEWFPLGVLIANVLGCFLLGLLMHDAVVAGKWLPTAGHAALTIGLLGALTTFSTFGYDTLVLLEAGRLAAASTNIVANGVLGIGACWVGSCLGGALWSAAQ